MTFPQLLVIISAFLLLWGGYTYLRDTLFGRAKPNRVSWFLWALAPLISLGAAFSAEADIWASVRVLVGGIVPGVIFLCSFVNSKSYWALTRFDWFCGGLSATALLFWQFADSPLTAVMLATIANTLASIPTFIKAWNFPETESRPVYIASFLSAILIIPAIPVWTIANSAFQIGLMITTGALLCAVYRKDFAKKEAI
ncbi:MAG: hypothetical protein CL398_05100 [Acidiferrobacteraceae bacterium]|nr:hypothetical protein [Acidiferrobacteraceae bacterium]